MRIFTFGASALAGIVLAVATAASVPSIASPVYVGVEGESIAVSGYDAVSYFTGDGAPVRGSSAHEVQFGGATYRFASADNAATFAANPAAYAPQYGGHCSWAAARGYLAPGDPTQYAVVDGRLFLNFNAEVKAMWDADRAGFIAAADRNWPRFPANARVGG